MNSHNPILSLLDADLVSALATRRDALRKALLGLGAAATVPTLLGAAATEAFGQGTQLPRKIRDVLNFALTLESLEDEFYRTALQNSGLVPDDARPIVEGIAKNEAAHVALLKSTLGSQAVKKPDFDFTAKGKFADVFTNYKTFLSVAAAFEETGVRAYKGQAPNLASNEDILTIALQIHSVEARHVAALRHLRGQKPWVTGNSRDDMPEATQPIYNGEAVFVQGGADLREVAKQLKVQLSNDDISEAFDEPLTKAQVLTIVKPFLAG